MTKSDDRAQLLDQLRPSDLSAIRQYIPSGVLDAYGAPICINEMRDITTVFISSLRAEVATVQEVVASVQRSCDFGGSLEKVLIDDKGLLFSLTFGRTAPARPDDAVRAALLCIDMVRILDELGLVGKCGVATGQCYCGGVD